MTQKNKQFKIEKGLMLFTQPRSPFFYGKIRLNKKYVTKSFAPITSRHEAEKELYIWRDELLKVKTASNIDLREELSERSDYIEQEELSNDFQFLEVGRFDPQKKGLEERKISFVEIYGEYNQAEASNQAHRCLDCGSQLYS
jgi:glutamate synthase (NADPH/NADH) small chain